MKRLGPAGQIENIGIELEEIANAQGALTEVKAWKDVLSRANRIQVLAARPSVARKKVLEVGMICRRCDLRMLEEVGRGRGRDFKCVSCGYHIGAVWGLVSQRQIRQVPSVEDA